MDVKLKSILGPFGVRKGMSKFSFEQARSIENDFTRITNKRAVFQNFSQFTPTDMRAVFLVQLAALLFGVGSKRLTSIFDCELTIHK